MIQKTKRICILAAAIAGVTLIGISTAQAQYRIDTGQANDANNRVGGNGSNGAANTRSASGIYGGSVSGNDIVIGNVTGGKEFHGNVPYSDPGSFHGVTSSRASDAFTKGSSGALPMADMAAWGIPMPKLSGRSSVIRAVLHRHLDTSR